MTPRAGLATFIEARRAQIDEALARVLPASPACPAVIAEAMRYSLMAGGKRLRPILTLAAADAVAAHPDRRTDVEAAVSLALPAACAIELIHTYSLIHDDLPAMDDDALRRGRPTSHVVFGEGIAILAGDALLTEAFRLLAREPASGAEPGELARRKLGTIAVVAQAAGAEGMVGGQAIDLQATARTAGPAPARSLANPDDLRAMHARKTGALIRAAAVAGALMAGGSEPLIEAADAYAAEIGLAFQIVDDILDVEGSAEELGKTAGKDAAAGKPTYPALYGLDESRRLAEACVERALAVLASAGLSGHLGALAEWVVGRRR